MQTVYLLILSKTIVRYICKRLTCTSLCDASPKLCTTAPSLVGKLSQLLLARVADFIEFFCLSYGGGVCIAAR